MFLAVVASWMNRDQLNTILYLLAEVEILKEQLDRKNIKLDLNNTQRRKLVKAGKKLGRKGLKEYTKLESGSLGHPVRPVTTESPFRWYFVLFLIRFSNCKSLSAL